MFLLEGFSVRIRPDYNKVSSNFHGFLEVHLDGVWGSVCADGWDTKAANVACRQLGYSGGAAYKPPKNFSSAILMDNVKCLGNEPSLKQCSYTRWSKEDGCDFYNHRAGLFCYNDTGNFFLLSFQETGN